ncbi:UPF0483 protein C25G4.2 [Aspergillus awamori]|uniref:UPF0483 protein C25G4.2 n=1 Tax=Aspergillus awamori TaxID=105351 RepID=A0A401KPP3_ASPAW|nr:UPF0483 protein C25G4.2 [Aspergillus awamori]GKZ58004.1 hypothetical protein AnigIFM49718_003809 [Aspergillus niger]GLA18394.1 hypothetical protein AnigIFM62618_006037 [Aspergillus niger]
MRILCLHGYGTSADALQYQLSGLLHSADPSWEFHMLSGEIECPPAPGIETNFTPPYYCWSRSFSAPSIENAHSLITEAIEDEGPFDGILGFSQGASIIASFLLEQTANHPERPLPFRFAIFCSTTIPCSSDPNYCRSITGGLSLQDQQRIRSGQDDQIAQLPASIKAPFEEFAKVVKAGLSITREPVSFFLDRSIEEIPCALHPDHFPGRLSIPTLHLRGHNDLPGLSDCASLVEKFCNPRCRKTIVHTAGHDIPRSGSELRQFKAGLDWLVAQSQLPTQ